MPATRVTHIHRTQAPTPTTKDLRTPREPVKKAEVGVLASQGAKRQRAPHCPFRTAHMALHTPIPFPNVRIKLYYFLIPNRTIRHYSNFS